LVIAVAIVVHLGGYGLGYGFLWYSFHRGPTDDLGRFQGEWQVDAYGRDGGVIRVNGDRWTYVAGGQEQRSYRLKLNPAANPGEIELIQLRPDGEPAVYTHGPERGSPVKMHGVYSVNMDGARVVLRPGVEPRPTSLDDPGDAQTLTLKRARQ
jgi:uncharacterized protein (TIGR03067 family)